MGPSDKSQHAIRRSSRLQLEVPVRLTSLSADFPFSEQCNTTLVNAHGCGVIAPRGISLGVRVRLEIVSAKRHTTARVAEVVPLGGDPETWLVGLELEVPGNFWGIEYAPSDWKIEDAPAPLEPRTEQEAAKPAGARRWRLTDVSSGACYLESAATFPSGTPVLVSVRIGAKEHLLDGVVRASHPQAGIGVEFMRAPEHRQRVEELIGELGGSRDVPRIFVGRKEGQQLAIDPGEARNPDSPDPLLDLVLEGELLSAEQFLSDLRAQRLGKRRDARIDIALPVLLTGVDVSGRPLDQRAMTVNISRRGALIEGIHGELAIGAALFLSRSGKKEEFRVAWVVDDDSLAGARIGVAAVDSNTEFWNEVLEATSQSGLEAAALRGSGGK